MASITLFEHDEIDNDILKTLMIFGVLTPRIIIDYSGTSAYPAGWLSMER